MVEKMVAFSLQYQKNSNQYWIQLLAHHTPENLIKPLQVASCNVSMLILWQSTSYESTTATLCVKLKTESSKESSMWKNYPGFILIIRFIEACWKPVCSSFHTSWWHALGAYTVCSPSSQHQLHSTIYFCIFGRDYAALMRFNSMFLCSLWFIKIFSFLCKFHRRPKNYAWST